MLVSRDKRCKWVCWLYLTNSTLLHMADLPPVFGSRQMWQCQYFCPCWPDKPQPPSPIPFIANTLAIKIWYILSTCVIHRGNPKHFQEVSIQNTNCKTRLACSRLFTADFHQFKCHYPICSGSANILLKHFTSFC